MLASGAYVLGPEVEAFEREFAAWLGAPPATGRAQHSPMAPGAMAETGAGPRAVGVASGTDALELALRAAGIGLGDEVITVSHTAVATVAGDVNPLGSARLFRAQGVQRGRFASRSRRMRRPSWKASRKSSAVFIKGDHQRHCARPSSPSNGGFSTLQMN